MDEGEQIWLKLRHELEKVMLPAPFTTFVAPVRYLDYHYAWLLLAAPNRFNQAYLQKKIPILIKNSLTDAGYPDVDVLVFVDQQKS